MIDFHCHILPGIDDGAKDWEESIAMARYLHGQGITGIVATPHWLEGYYTPEPGEVLDRAVKLQGRLDRLGIPVRVYPGCEAHISLDLPDLVQQKKVLTVNNGGRYLLVEFPFHEVPLYAEDVLFRLKLSGITPIIAHPERNDVFASEPARLISLIRKGTFVQVNAGSFLGLYGRKVESASRTLAAGRAAHVIGSDMHGCSRKGVPVTSSLTVLKDIAGAEEADRIVRIRTAQVLAGETVVADEPCDAADENRLGLLRRLLGKIVRPKT